jgi:hypothetical protein
MTDLRFQVRDEAGHLSPWFPATIPVSSGDGTPTFPTKTSVGYRPTGITLKPYTGPLVITTPGTVLEGYDIPGGVAVRARDVTIRKSLVRGTGSWAVRQEKGGDGLLLEDTDVTTKNTGSGRVDRAVQFEAGNGTLRRCSLYATQRGIALASHVLVEDTYHGENSNDTDAHSSAIACWGGCTDVTLRRSFMGTAPNTNASSSMSCYPESGPNSYFTITETLFESGGGYVFYFGYTPPGEQPNHHFVLRDNWVSTKPDPKGGFYGCTSLSNGWSASEWTNQRWYDLRPSTGGYKNKHGTQIPLSA